MAYRTEDVVVDVGGGERIKYEVYVDLETGLDIDPVTGDMKSREDTIAYLKEVYNVGASGDLRQDLDRYNQWIKTPGAKEKEKSLFRQADGGSSSKPSSLFSSADKRKSDALALKEAGNDALSTGKFRLAIKRYSEGLALDSTSVALWANRSEAHLRLKRFAEALKDADMALSLDRTHEKSLFRRCSAAIGLGDTMSALKDVAEGQRRFNTNHSWVALSNEIQKLLDEPIAICAADEELNTEPSLIVRRWASAGESLGMRIDNCVQWSPQATQADGSPQETLRLGAPIQGAEPVQAVIAAISMLPSAEARASKIQRLWEMFRTFETSARYSYAVVSSNTVASRHNNDSDFQVVDAAVARLALALDGNVPQEKLEEIASRAEGVVHRLVLYSRLGAILSVGQTCYLHPMFLLLRKSASGSRAKADAVVGSLLSAKVGAVDIVSKDFALCSLLVEVTLSSAVNQRNTALAISSPGPAASTSLELHSEPKTGQWWFGV
jgi:tetratricopeptide (TPR) repeat protein